LEDPIYDGNERFAQVANPAVPCPMESQALRVTVSKFNLLFLLIRKRFYDFVGVNLTITFHSRPMTINLNGLIFRY
jgi:hypothetical protein